LERFFILFLSTICGFAFGSFLNVVVLRLHNKQKGILNGRSFCPNCKNILKALDLVPVFSFLFLRGKCRYCKQKISWQYFLAEISLGIIWGFVAFYLFQSLATVYWPVFLFYLFVITILFVIALYDFLYLEVPSVFTFPFIFFLIISLFFPFTPAFLDGILGAVVLFVFFYLQILIPYFIYSFKKKKWSLFLEVLVLPFWFLLQVISVYRWNFDLDEDEDDTPKDLVEWVGFGDLRIAVIMGLLLGFKFSLIALFVAYILGALIGVIILIKTKKKRNTMALGPFLVLGTFLTLFFGANIMDLYYSLTEIFRNFVWSFMI